MPWEIVEPIMDVSVRGLCVKPYPLHKRGCPNFGKKDGCPPNVPILSKVIDLSKNVVAIWNCFNLGAHVSAMKLKHPQWSDRQLYCCLYWQPKARKQLALEILKFKMTNPTMRIIYCPEALGVNITKTMSGICKHLQWPPIDRAYQVVLAGFSLPDREEKK